MISQTTNSTQQIQNSSMKANSGISMKAPSESYISEIFTRLDHINSNLERVGITLEDKLHMFLEDFIPMEEGDKNLFAQKPPFFMDIGSNLDTLDSKISYIQSILGRIRL